MTGQPWLRQQCAERVGAFDLRYDLQLSSAWTVVFGPSGTGKSTWLRMLAGLVPQRTGSLLLHGEDIRSFAPHRRRVGLVEQSPSLFPHLNVERNIGFVRRAGPEYQEAFDTLLGEFRLTRLRHAPVSTLSGGERQRVAIARALCPLPRVLLLDEVFTGTDANLRGDLISVLHQYQQQMHMPIVSVTHDVAEAFTTAEEVLRMHNGHILAQGPPAQVLNDERNDLLIRLEADHA